MLIPVKAKLGNGQVLLTLQLLSPTGVKIGAPTAVTVDVHADWEGIGALIIGVLLVLLFGFGIVRNVLRRRRERGAGDAERGEDGTVNGARNTDGEISVAEGPGSHSAEAETADVDRHPDDTKEPSV